MTFFIQFLSSVLFKMILSAICILGFFWFIATRQYIFFLFTVILACIFWLNNFDDNTKMITLEIPIEISRERFMININNINLNDKNTIMQAYEKIDDKKYVLKESLSSDNKNRISAIFKAIKFYPPINLFLWMPSCIEPGSTEQITMSIQLAPIYDTADNYRISVPFNENILICDDFTNKENRENYAIDKDYLSNIVFQGMLTVNEIKSKKITVYCLKQSRNSVKIQFILETKNKNNQWLEERWQTGDCELKIRAKLETDITNILFLTGFIGSIISILFQFMDALKRRNRE